MSDTTENRADGECFGVSFYVDSRWRFVVPDIDKSFESYEKMQAAMEGQAKRIEATKKVKLSLPVLSYEGMPTTIVGVHAGHGRGLLNPKIEIGWHGAFPDVPWIRAAIARRIELQDQVNDIERVLRRFALDIDNYRNKYGSSPEGLQTLYDATAKKAQATSLQQELGKKCKSDD